MAPALDRPPATLEGLLKSPCDPLLLAVSAGTPPSGLTQEVDWRLAGQIARLVAEGLAGAGPSVLLPESPILPSGRLVLVTKGIEAGALAQSISRLFGADVGLCPEEFGYSETQARGAFGDRAILFSGVS